MGDNTYEIPFDDLIVDGPNAWLIRLRWVDSNFTIWIPKSVGEIDIDDGIMDVPRWLMQKIADKHRIQEFYQILDGEY